MGYYVWEVVDDKYLVVTIGNTRVDSSANVISDTIAEGDISNGATVAESAISMAKFDMDGYYPFVDLLDDLKERYQQIITLNHNNTAI